MATVRTNMARNPHGVTSTGWYWSAAGGAATLSPNAGTDTPDGRSGYMRATITSANASGNAGVYYRDDGVLSGHAGDKISLSMFVRISADDPPPFVLQGSLRAGNKDVQSISSSAVTPIGGGWTRLTVTGTATVDFDGFQVYARESAPDVPPVGSTVDATMVLVELADAVAVYFDGDTPDTDVAAYAWTGDQNASSSTETYTGPPSITASILTSSTVPPPVQLVLANIPAGDTYAVVGIAPGGRTWQVAGGYGTSEGVQVVLVDNRAPVNVPIRYRLVTPTGTYDSNTVTVPWTPDGSQGKYLVQSLDGRTIVPIAAWNDNQLPKQPVLNTTGFDIRGRRRPVMVLATAGEGTMTVQWRLHRADSAKLDQIIADGGGIALRTDGTARDLPVSDVAVITSASSQLWAADNGVSTDRVWDLELTWIDDPEPSTIPVVWSVGDVDALLAGKTVADVDALFAGMTVADVDSQDWGTLDA